MPSKGPAFNTNPRFPLVEMTGICDHQRNKYAKPCGAFLTLRTWTDAHEGVVRCPNCRKAVRVNAK